jgi:hypothetical protein
VGFFGHQKQIAGASIIAFGGRCISMNGAFSLGFRNPIFVSWRASVENRLNQSWCQATDLKGRLKLEDARSLSGDKICSTIGPPERFNTTLYRRRFGLVQVHTTLFGRRSLTGSPVTFILSKFDQDPLVEGSDCLFSDSSLPSQGFFSQRTFLHPFVKGGRDWSETDRQT